MSSLPTIPVPPAPDDTARRPWDQLPGEPALWYGRFALYRDLGPGRSITAASRAERTAKGLHPWPPNESWHRTARTWYWRERALAWDAYHRELLSLSEYNLRLAYRDRRVAIIEETLDNVCTALDAAHLEEMTQDEARKAFPQTRRFLLDLLAAERKEFEHAICDEDATRPTITITADDLRAAQRELERSGWQPEFPVSPALPALPDLSAPYPVPDPVTGSLANPAPHLARSAPAKDLRLRLFICPPLDVAHAALPADPPSDYPSAGLDPADMRAAGLPVNHIYRAHRTKFCEAFGRERTLRRPIELLHLDLPTTPAGIEFANGLTAPHWQIRHADCLRVVVLARHTGGVHPPACLAHVPFVVTLDAELPPAAARAFTTHFWQAVAAGQAPSAAYAATLAACPPDVAAHVACCGGGT